MSLRLFVESPMRAGLEFFLPDDAARHVQVRRLQPGDGLKLFDGLGGEWQAQVLRMGKREVEVRVDTHDAVDRELPMDLEIALGMPTNERMDALVEKATELGVAAIQPLHSERSVLRLDGERAAKRVAHWQAVAVSASEQSGRTRVPAVRPVRSLAAWLAAMPEAGGDSAGFQARFVMSTGTAPRLAHVVDACIAASAAGAPGGRAGAAFISADSSSARSLDGRPRWLALSGPEGGLAPDEESAAIARGFSPVSLGALILRADTAPLAWLAQMALLRGV